MKKIFVIFAAMAVLFSASCQKSPVSSKENGYLSLSEFNLEVDETVLTKADPAGDNYSIVIYNAEDVQVVAMTYAQVKENNDMITLPAGSYTLVARSLAGEVPAASWENPIYGTTREFAISAGETTSLGELVCTLVQCKVTVSYSDDFLASVTGDGKTSVEVTAGYPLDYQLSAKGTYDQSAGFFAVNGTTMKVEFKGSINGKTAKMTKTFTGIAPKQWRQVRFVQKTNEQGQATFDIEIVDLISDSTLNNTLDAEEDVIGEDPEAPKGDGGITLDFDYDAGCDKELTDLTNMVIVPVETRDMNIKLKAQVPGGVLKFTVEIDSDNEAFRSALDAAGGSTIDLVNPSPANDIIFQVVPFPHGKDLLGQTEIAFDLSAAQDAIINYKGTHTFLMTVVDNAFCTKKIPVTMIVR